MGKVKIAIPGLDELLEGGYVENNVILVTGCPGTGKITFDEQYSWRGQELLMSLECSL
jgi:KaiC/GvpD/RAD55 family RecA-like ATPase